MASEGQLEEATNSKSPLNLPLSTSTLSGDVTTTLSHRDVNLELVAAHVENVLAWFILDLALAVFIIMGNGLTLAAVCKTRALQTQANMYVVSLALSDMVGGVYLLVDAAWILPVAGAAFDRDEALCLFREGTLYLGICSSMITMVTIAVDKLLYVAAPFLHRRAVTTEKTLIVIVVSWCVSVMYGSLVYHVSVFDHRLGCQLSTVLNPHFVFFGCTAPVSLAIVIISGCYLEIVRIVLKHRRKIRALNQPFCDLDRDSYRKSLKLFLAVLGVFVVCWVPFTIQGFVFYQWEDYYHDVNVYRAFLALALLNCGLNFFLYAWKNRDFRQAYKKLLLDCCYAKQNTATTVTVVVLNEL